MHVSGHPRRGELAQMYEWTRPRISIPLMARRCTSPSTRSSRAGRAFRRSCRPATASFVRLAPGPAEIIDTIPVGRLYKDGTSFFQPANARCRSAASSPSRASSAWRSPSTSKGEIAGDPVVEAMGLPAKNRKGEDLTEIVADVGGDLLDGLPKVKRRDADAVENAVQRRFAPSSTGLGQEARLPCARH